jgi:hypothetical protein
LPHEGEASLFFYSTFNVERSMFGVLTFFPSDSSIHRRYPGVLSGYGQCSFTGQTGQEGFRAMQYCRPK